MNSYPELTPQNIRLAMDSVTAHADYPAPNPGSPIPRVVAVIFDSRVPKGYFNRRVCLGVAADGPYRGSYVPPHGEVKRGEKIEGALLRLCASLVGVIPYRYFLKDICNTFEQGEKHFIDIIYEITQYSGQPEPTNERYGYVRPDFYNLHQFLTENIPSTILGNPHGWGRDVLRPFA